MLITASLVAGIITSLYWLVKIFESDPEMVTEISGWFWIVLLMGPVVVGLRYLFILNFQARKDRYANGGVENDA